MKENREEEEKEKEKERRSGEERGLKRQEVKRAGGKIKRGCVVKEAQERKE